MRSIQRWLFVVAAMVVAACSGDNGTEPGSRAVANVIITPATPEVIEGGQVTLTARTVDVDGGQLTGRVVTWSSSDETTAKISNVGILEAFKSGQVQITATSEGRSASVNVLVTPIAVASVELDATNVALAEGANRQLVATAKSASGQVLTGRFVGWTSSDPTIVAVDVLGKLTAVRAGAVTVTATVHGKSASAQVVVSADYDYDLLYSAWDGEPGVFPELWRVNINQPGGMPARVFPGKPAADATPSPDGTRVAFIALYEGTSQIYVANMDGTNAKRLTSGPEQNDQPAWSPDGSSIAFRKWNVVNVGQSDIWVMNPDGTDARNLTSDMGQTNQTSPAWSPMIGAGYRIAFSSQTNDPNGEAHLFTMAADGSDKKQITTGVVFDDQPAWSPDGASIAFERYSAAIQGDLFAINATGGNERRLSPAGLAFGQFDPVWSPDGKLVAFTSKHGDGTTYQVYTVWADGSKLAQRTFDERTKTRPEFVARN